MIKTTFTFLTILLALQFSITAQSHTLSPPLRIGSILLETDTGRKFKTVEYLGGGSFAHVYQAEVVGPDLYPPFVLKIYHDPREYSDTSSQTSQIILAIRNYKQMKIWNNETKLFPYIFEVPLHLLVNGKQVEAVMMELYGSNLEQVSGMLRFNFPDPQELIDARVDTAFRVLADETKRLLFFHEKGYFFNDLQARNIVLSPTGHFSIVDLDTYRPISEATSLDSDWDPAQNDFYALAHVLVSFLVKAFPKGEFLSPQKNEYGGKLSQNTEPLFENHRTVVDLDEKPKEPIHNFHFFAAAVIKKLRPLTSDTYKAKLETLDAFINSYSTSDAKVRPEILKEKLGAMDSESLTKKTLWPILESSQALDCRKKIGKRLSRDP